MAPCNEHRGRVSWIGVRAPVNDIVLLRQENPRSVGRRDFSDNLVRPETNLGVPQSSAGLLALALSLIKKCVLHAGAPRTRGVEMGLLSILKI
jgi:hypothetical protein